MGKPGRIEPCRKLGNTPKPGLRISGRETANHGGPPANMGEHAGLRRLILLESHAVNKFTNGNIERY